MKLPNLHKTCLLFLVSVFTTGLYGFPKNSGNWTAIFPVSELYSFVNEDVDGRFYEVNSHADKSSTPVDYDDLEPKKFSKKYYDVSIGARYFDFSALFVELLVEGGFDGIATSNTNGNNFLSAAEINPWIQENPSQINVVNVDGPGGGNYGGGPNVDARGGAGNYYDVNGTTTVYQSFTIAEASAINYSAYFSARDGNSNVGGGQLNIYEGTGIGGPLVSSITGIVASSSSSWDFVSNSVILPANTYTIQVVLANPQNVDEVSVQAAPIAEADVDNDLVLNTDDVDSDNDGIYDSLECGVETKWVSRKNRSNMHNHAKRSKV